MADANEQQPETLTEYSALKGLWDKLNKNADGVVDGKEWGSNVNKYLDNFKSFFPGETVKEIGQYFNKTDSNDDDVITWPEFVAAADLGSLKKLYLSLDVNGDGKVSSKEFGQNLSANFEKMRAVFGGVTLKEVGEKFNSINSSLQQSESGEQYLSWAEFHKGWLNTTVVPEFVDLKALWDSMEKTTVKGVEMINSKTWGQQVGSNKDVQELVGKIFGGATLKELGMKFNKVDGNDDEYLTWTEMVQACSAAQGLTPLKTLFMEMDKDGSGFVDSKEWGRQLKAYLERLGHFFKGRTISQMGKMFNDIDTDKDDQISWSEMKAAIIRDNLVIAEKEKELQDLAKMDNVNPESIAAMESMLKERDAKKAAEAAKES